ncbi:MAG TPA: hypothetical protein V6D48_03750 [Oculatellaceae cyanobacterium]|jgi:hypothetical protein|uniref:hypothetical protein n=1 Tax=Allocoleopsis sp. TaxID=3088169 RepID=UPI002FD67457
MKIDRKKKLQIWLSDEEYARLDAESTRQGVPMAQLMRSFIRRLPPIDSSAEDTRNELMQA